MKLSTKLWILSGLLTAFLLTTCSSYVYTKAVDMHNVSQDNILSYKQIDEQIVTLFDANYLTYAEKSKITNLNKETFINVTQIIMSNRKDGEQLAWKWVTENTLIPYEEFTVFYKDLSDFVSTQYSSIYALERDKQALVKRHNLMLRQWPNNIFNSYLNIESIDYTKCNGLLSKKSAAYCCRFKT
jgi:hypothetical protein